jgi:hypothetical protein
MFVQFVGRGPDALCSVISAGISLSVIFEVILETLNRWRWL